jgi:hypothetical protein
VKDIRIQMTPTGHRRPRLRRYGDPVSNAAVQALKYTYQDGRRVLSVVQSGRTNGWRIPSVLDAAAST